MSLTAKQLEQRRTYIGSSDAKTIYESDVYAWENLILQKRNGESIEFDKNARLRIDAGNHMESFVLDQFTKLAKVTIRNRGVGYDNLFMHSTTDAMAVTGHVIEAKTHWGFMTMDELGDLYAPQCQHHMLVTETEYLWLPVFFGVRARLEWRKVKRDEEWIEQYKIQATKFYKWLMDDEKPDDMEFMLPPVWSDMFVTNTRNMDLDEQTLAILNLGGQQIIEAKKATEESNLAKIVFKDLLPEKCKQMDYDMGGNLDGHTIRVTRSKSNTLTLKHIAPKEAKTDEQ